MITNVAFGLLSFLLSYVVAFFISPYILRQLGDTRYGIWALFGELLTYYALLDLGVRTALNYYLGGALANNRKTDLSQYASSAFVMLGVLSTTALFASVGLVFAFADRITPAGVDPAEVSSGAALFLVVFCIGLPMEVFAAVVIAHRRWDVVSSSEILAKLTSTILMVGVLRWWPTIPMLCVAQLIGRSLYWACNIYFSRRIVGGRWFALDQVHWGAMKELVGYGGQNAFINIATVIVNRKDVTVVTLFAGAALVPNYAFARLLVQTVTDIGNTITQALRPNVIYHWARNETEHAYTIYYESARYSAYVMWVGVAGLFVLGREFLSFWIGERFVTGSIWNRSDVVLAVLLIGHLPRMMHAMSRQVLFATSKHRALAVQMAGEAVANLALALILIRPFGLLGLALASAIPMLISDGIALTRTMKIAAGVSLRRLAFKSIAPAGLTAAGVYAAGMVFRHFIVVRDWMTLAAVAGLTGLTAIVAGYVFVLSPAARAWVWTIGPKLMTRFRGGILAV